MCNILYNELKLIRAITQRRDLFCLLTNRVCLSTVNLLSLLVIQLMPREIFAGNYHVIQVPVKEMAARRTAKNPRLTLPRFIIQGTCIVRFQSRQYVPSCVFFFTYIFLALIESHQATIEFLQLYFSLLDSLAVTLYVDEYL